MGQAAYLSRHHMSANDYDVGFYVSVPGKFFKISFKCCIEVVACF